MAKRGRPKIEVPEEDLWVPVRKYKYNQEHAYNTMQKMKRERVLAGYSKLYKIVFERDIQPYEMKLINNLADRMGF